jgi:molybdate-binding protein/transcriptional regulator with XRE-family HTH domain
MILSMPDRIQSRAATIGARVRRGREARGESQIALARRAGVSRAQISAIETGRLTPSVSAALALARALGSSVEALFDTSGATDAPAGLGDAKVGTRLWQATVGERTWFYPTEATDLGMSPHDAVLRDEGPVRLEGAAPPEDTLVLAGCDPAVGILADGLRGRGVRLLALTRPSRAALALLDRGAVHVAGAHLAGAEGSNAAAIRAHLGRRLRLLRLGRWESGLVLDPGLGLRSVRSALRQPLRWVGRPEGSGAARILSQLTADLPRRPRGLNREASDHRAVAEAIRTGFAQAGVATRLVAEEGGLAFLSVEREPYDLCFLPEQAGDPRIVALIETLRDPAIRARLADLPGYDARETGEFHEAR